MNFWDCLMEELEQMDAVTAVLLGAKGPANTSVPHIAAEQGECSMVNKQEFVGFDAKGNKVFIGSRVNHTVKGFTRGTVVEGFASYKGEPAVIVDYPGIGNWLNRLSKLVVAPPEPPKPKAEKLPELVMTLNDGRVLKIQITIS
jgi:hypothetical protein